MHILCTNDDGVTAPGLLALAQELRSLGEVSILAPDHNWSASGHVKTLHRPLQVKSVTLADGTIALACDGAPSDCVALALMGVIPTPIDLVVSGINPYANVGQDLTYSGTVTAAMEAVINRVPGLAVSLDGVPGALTSNYAQAAKAARQVVEQLAHHSLPPGILLNINVPNLPDGDLHGFRITRQGQRIYRDKLEPRQDPHGRPYYWIGGEAPTGLPEEGTDFGALAQQCVSVTPIHLDLTAYALIDTLRAWEWPQSSL